MRLDKNAAKDKWSDVRPFAELEFQKITRMIAELAEMCASGEITEERAQLLLDMQKNASRQALLTVEGLGILAIEQALDAALGAISKSVNRELGFKLL